MLAAIISSIIYLLVEDIPQSQLDREMRIALLCSLCQVDKFSSTTDERAEAVVAVSITACRPQWSTVYLHSRVTPDFAKDTLLHAVLETRSEIRLHKHKSGYDSTACSDFR
jgi:hypothetical protein